MHLKVQDTKHILQNSPTHAPENPGYQTHPAEQPYPWPESPKYKTHPAEQPYPCTWKSRILNTSCRTALPMTWNSRIPNTSCRTALPMHLKIQDPEHILQNSPTHAPESPGSWTHPADLPYPCTWKSRIPNTSCRTALPMHLKIQDPEHILQNSPTHAPESPGSWTHPAEQPYPCTWKSRIPNISCRPVLPMYLLNPDSKNRFTTSVLRPLPLTGYVIGLQTLSANSFPLIFEWQ